MPAADEILDVPAAQRARVDELEQERLWGSERLSLLARLGAPPLAASPHGTEASGTPSAERDWSHSVAVTVASDPSGDGVPPGFAGADPRAIPPATSAASSTRLTPDEEVALFRSLFRGRTDVYPKLRGNEKTGRKMGYSPACERERERDVCQKPQVKCAECPQQAFIPVSDAVVRRHLEGSLVMGVYPLLEGDTCWFVAADFDEAPWMEDVTAFRETCRVFDVPVTVERSRSGRGGHVWIFFADPVLAAVARMMVSLILTETMSRRHEISMNSYHLIFPDQDTMPRGGFGNLIALPLQGKARVDGNTMFLDDDFQPYPDPWAYLLSVRRMTLAEVDRVAREASRQRDATGARAFELAEDGVRPASWVPARARNPCA